MIVDEIIDRLKARIPEFRGRVDGAASLAALAAAEALPKVTPCAHVVPAGVTGRAETALTGIYRQNIDRLYAVLLTIDSHDRDGARGLDEAERLIEAVHLALLGWTPPTLQLEGVPNVFRLRATSLTRFEGGKAAYQTIVALEDQVRIQT